MNIDARVRYDSKDALVAYQSHAHQACSTVVGNLLSEYYNVCETYAATKIARKIHENFIAQLENSRSLLTKQKRSGNAFTIVRHEWGKEHFKKLRASWNVQNDEYVQEATEAAAAWVLQNESYSGYEQMDQISSLTCYVPSIGMVLQKWVDIRDAKNFVNCLHAFVNAPLSKIFTPFAISFEILGYVIVAMSLAPVSSDWSNWRDLPLAVHQFTAITASLRFMKPHSIRTESEIDFSSLKNIKFSSGSDGRWYLLDARDAPLMGQTFGEEGVARQCPRRELLFAASGVCTTPYCPNEFIIKFKLKTIFEQILSGVLVAEGSDFRTVSALMHFHGVSFTPCIFQLFNTANEQERTFRGTLQTVSRKEAALTPQAAAKLAKFAACKIVILTEVFSRVLKRLLQYEWKRILHSESFLALLKKAITNDESDEASESSLEQDSDHDDIKKEPSKSKKGGKADGTVTLESLNQELIRATNLLLSALFAASAKSGLTISEEFFDDFLFIVNDTFVKRVVGEKVGTKFECERTDLAIPQLVSTLSSLLGIRFLQRGGKVIVDPEIDFFETFFDLESSDASPLRSSPTATTVELPLCLVAGSRAKMTDFMNLQNRIAAKIVAQTAPDLPKEISLYYLSIAQSILLYAVDVQIAQRGHLQDQDTHDVLTLQLPFVVVPTTAALRQNQSLEVEVLYRKIWFLGPVDLPQVLKLFIKYNEKTRALFDSPVGSSFLVSQKITLLCNVCENFASPALVDALETVVNDLNRLTVAAEKNSGVLSTSASQARSQYHLELKLEHCAHLFLAPLSLLVHHVMQKDTKRSQNESISLAVKYCTKRRDVIKAACGEVSVETGIACNDIAAICSNNKYDFERAEEEFEHAVLILSEAQPEGPAVFIAMNNLAFLYFRKAERLRKNPQLQTKAEDAANPRETINNLLQKAEQLLEDVMRAERKISTLDFAAALNNFASILLFQNRFNPARGYFLRTLEVTEDLKREGEDIPCRVHAQKNLRILARKQYLNAVLRVQTLVKRFIVKLRTRKAVTQLRAAMPIQRLGRAMIVRNFLAQKYRFSAYHWWLRQPRAFTKKLGQSYANVSVDVRRQVWGEIAENSAALLQRCSHGYQSRHYWGQILNFQKEFFEDLRIGVETEVDRRRATTMSREVLHILLFYAVQSVEQLIEIKMKSVRYEMWIVQKEVAAEERRVFKILLEDEETSRRGAIKLTFQREFQEMLDTLAQVSMLEKEARLRREIWMDFSLNMFRQFGESLAIEERLEFTRKIEIPRKLHYLQYLESQMRQNIEMEFYIVMRGEKFMSVVPKCGRGFIARKFCSRYLKLSGEEMYRRYMIQAEEVSRFSFEALEREWQLHAIYDNESEKRKRIEKAAFSFFEVSAEGDNQQEVSPLSFQFHEFRSRIVLGISERDARDEIMAQEILAQLQQIQQSERMKIASESFFGFCDVLFQVEQSEFSCIQDQHAAEFRKVLFGHFGLQMQLLEAEESRFRMDRVINEGAEWISTILYSVNQHFIDEKETVQRQEMLKEMTEVFQRQRETDKRLRKFEFERNEMQQEESTQRKVVADENADFYCTLQTSLFLQCRVESGNKALHALFDDVAEWCVVQSREEKIVLFQLAIDERKSKILVEMEVAQRKMMQFNEILESNTRLSAPCKANLGRIFDLFLENAFHSADRQLLSHEEERSRLLLEAQKSLTIIYDSFMNNPLYNEIALTQIFYMEKGQRKRNFSEFLSGICALKAQFFLSQLQLTVVRDQTVEFVDTIAWQGIENEERLFREKICREQNFAVALLRCMAGEEKSRHGLVPVSETSYLSICLLYLHATYCYQVILPGLEKTSIKLQEKSRNSKEEFLRNRKIVLLQRVGRGMAFRSFFGNYIVNGKKVVSLFQRIGRAFYARRRLAVFFAENVEHCFVYASENQLRHSLLFEESCEFSQICVLFAATEPVFISSTKVPQKPRKQQLFSTPLWQSTHLYYAGQSSYKPRLYRKLSDDPMRTNNPPAASNHLPVTKNSAFNPGDFFPVKPVGQLRSTSSRKAHSAPKKR